MYIDPVRHSGRPTDDRIPQEMAIYDELERQGISFERVDHDHADTMEDCRKIEEVLDAKICKNLFLCNRQQTEFYLLMMPGEKPFKTKYLSAQLGCSRLSFADDGHMAACLNTIPGSVSALELLFGQGGPGAAGHRPGVTGGCLPQRTPRDLHLHGTSDAGGSAALCGGSGTFPHLYRSS
ncbi:MAG: YbaK/EbsC family protein [Lawsonibacter sp.]